MVREADADRERGAHTRTRMRDTIGDPGATRELVLVRAELRHLHRRWRTEGLSRDEKRRYLDLTLRESELFRRLQHDVGTV